jgi:hypothetical protein
VCWRCKKVVNYVAFEAQVEYKANKNHDRVGWIVLGIFEKYLVYFKLSGVRYVLDRKLKKLGDASVHEYWQFL